MARKTAQETNSNGRGLALVYCRVSTKSQEDGTSLDTQADACIKFAQSQGYTIGRVTKEVYSGAELWDRPQLARDRAALKSGQFQALICYSTDRLSRDPIHLAIIAEECERAGTPLLFVTEPLDTSPEAGLIRYVKGYAAQMEREKIKERTLRGRKGKLISGKPTFHGWDLYGYRSIKKENRYEVYEPEASIVRRIFNMCASGYGAHAIASKLNSEGIPAPKVSLRPGVHWSGATLYRILTNPSYKGEEYQWKTKRNSRKHDKPRPRSEWVRLPDGIRPPIVSENLWQLAQDGLKSNTGATKRNEDRPVLLRGIIFCANCGWRMIRNHYKKEKYEYDKYRCGSHWRPFKLGCKGKGVPFDASNEWAWQKVKAILLNPEIVAREVKRLEQAGPDTQLISDLESTRRRLAQVERGLQALLRRFRQSAENDTIWPYIEREIGQATKERQQLETTISKIESRITQQMQVVTDLRSLNDYCDQVRGELEKFTFEDKRLAFRALGVQVFANGDNPEKWQFKVRFPFYFGQSDDVKAFHVGSSARL